MLPSVNPPIECRGDEATPSINWAKHTAQHAGRSPCTCATIGKTTMAHVIPLNKKMARCMGDSFTKDFTVMSKLWQQWKDSVHSSEV